MTARIIPFPSRRPESAGNPFLGVAWGAALWLIMAAAFVEPAADYADFTRAMTRKLVRETGTPEIGALE